MDTQNTDTTAPVSPRRSVVSYDFKAKYAERGNPRGCGDWLHVTLDQLTRDKKTGKTNRADLVALLEANGVDCARWKGKNTGLLRMGGRLSLQACIVRNDGRLVVPGQKRCRRAPADFIAKHAS